MKRLKALGVYGGIGSMMIGAKRQGWDIIGNIEDRDYFFTGTFEANFPESFLVHSVQEMSDEQRERCSDLDLIIGHPKCGSFSSLRHHNSSLDESQRELKGNFIRFISIVNEFKPKFFAIDNLPKSLDEFDYSQWAETLSDYDIHFEYVSNYHYGNIQSRKRLFVIGSRKELGFYFIPGEFNHNETVRERLSKISDSAPNNQQWSKDDICEGWYRHNIHPEFTHYGEPEDKITYREFEELLKRQKIGKSIECYNKKGLITKKIGKYVVDIDRKSKVLTGGNTGKHYLFRSDTWMPFTIRERAKIGGCPDDFIFIPDKNNELKKWHNNLIHQTGKFMPVEFTSFLTQQIADFLGGCRDESKYTGDRLIRSDDSVDVNKYGYCKNIGYSNQAKVCEYCGSKEYCDKMKKLS